MLVLSMTIEIDAKSPKNERCMPCRNEIDFLNATYGVSLGSEAFGDTSFQQ